MTNTNISNRAGRHSLTENLAVTLPDIEDYSPDEIASSESWPAIQRYLSLLNRQGAKTQSDQLRLKRHRLWLRCALATYFDRASAKDICLFWSKAAEDLIQDAWRIAGCDKAGFALLALGKLGAEELNLSSDVDVIAVRGDGTPPPDLKSLREFQSLLSENTEFGFALRVDLSLRPGGSASTIIPTLTEFEYHYGYHGEMWERLAYVRMRALQGPDDVVKSIREFTRKFSYRRHLDYTLLDELKALRAKIRQEKFEPRPGVFHLKLGEGGIRELELFVHALQVIHGGRNAALQTHSTSLAIQRIRELKLLPESDCDLLLSSYWFLRRIENRLQAFEDQQTYLLEKAHLIPINDADTFDKVKDVAHQVSTIATSLFGEKIAPTSLSENLDSEDQWLRDKGFSKTSCEETWPALLAATALSRQSERDEKARLAFLRGFVTKLAENRLDRDLGLSLLLDFVKSIRAKASFFTLLNREPRVRDELAMLFSISPYLGSILTSRPELIDEFIYRKQAEPSSDFNTLLDELAERRLLSELVTANHFLADRDLQKLSANITANADAICTTLLHRLQDEYAIASDLGLVALGKWGGRELGLRSDLDFIFVTSEAPTAADQKVARRFLARMTEAHRGGSIYSIDMRLRPSGSAGPMLVPAAELHRYLNESAAAWERQAYLRARILEKPLAFNPAQVAASRGLSEKDLDELRSIRSQLFVSALASQSGELDLKLSLGGLADVEFTAQIALLARREFSLDPSTSGMIQYLESVDAEWREIGSQVRKDYESLRGVEQLYQLTTSQSGSKMRLKSDEFRRLALVLDQSPADLEASVRVLFDRISLALKKVRTLDR